MTHSAGSDRSRLLLLPNAMDDYVGSGNPVRIIVVLFDQLNLQGAPDLRMLHA